MKSNGLLKWLTIPALLSVVFLAIKLFSGPAEPGASARHDQVSDAALTAEESRQLRADADTPHDTVATLVAQVKALRGELKAALDENAKHKAENERLRAHEGALDQRLQSALMAERETWRKKEEQSAEQQRQTQGVLEELKRRIEGLGGKDPTDAELPVGLGLEGEPPWPATGLRWIEPQDMLPRAVQKDSGTSRSAKLEPARPSPFGDAQVGTDAPPLEDATARSKKSATNVTATPVYTASQNATLIGSIALTALIGRIPIDGTVNDPYPFKVLIGADNLIANGFELPELAGAVMSGTASGDWTLSCVRGQIRSITFVFADGTERTIARESGAERTTEGGLGWISDPYGTPCVSGERYSNAKQYLTTQMLLTAAGAGAASLIDSDDADLAVVSGRNGTALGSVGLTGNEALQRILAGGVHEMSQWVNKLYGQAFAAIFVPPGAKVAVHLEEPLHIDLDPNGRKVHYEYGGTHAPELD